MLNILAFSDSHMNHTITQFKIDLEQSIDTNFIDVVICAGDFSNGTYQSTVDFIKYFSSLEVKYKIIVAGNHEKALENKEYKKELKDMMEDFGIIYLEDNSVVVEGIKFYGSPWTNHYMNWAFMKTDKEMRVIFDSIDEDTEVLITHGPAYEILDKIEIENTPVKMNVGSIALKEAIEELKSLKYHIFGHIHPQHGYFKNGNVEHYNVSVCGLGNNFLYPFTFFSI